MSETKKDNLACATVLATMLVTMACGALVVDVGPDSHAQPADVRSEAQQ
jgi:hypothetical protein